MGVPIVDPIFLPNLNVKPEMKPISNIVQEIQYLTIFFILDLQEHIYRQVEKTDYPSAGSAGRWIVGLGDLSVDIFLEVQIQKYS